MEEFEKLRAARNPETLKFLLPLKDVVTRWNSKEAAIARVLRLRATIESFTTRAKGKNCPRFNKQVFDALRLIQPSLQVFLGLTQVYSEVGAHAHRIIPELINAMDDLKEYHQHPSVSSVHQNASERAVDKLHKYLQKFLVNKWVCAALALDPAVREEGLQRLLVSEYEEEQFDDTTNFIKDRIAVHQASAADGGNQTEEEIEWVHQPRRVNKFAINRFQVGEQPIQHNTKDPWDCYNSDVKRYATKPNEPPLKYWKRMSEETEMRPLAMVAKDVLGLAGSSATVEILFSHAGHVLGKRRGSLSARLLSKQTMLRMWEMQVLLAAEDL